MQVPIIPFRGSKKPWNSIPRIDWGHRLARGLVFYGYDTGGGIIVDLVSGSRAQRVGTVNSNRPSSWGMGLHHVDGAGFWAFSTLSTVNKALAKPYSAACAWSFPTLPSLASCGFGTCRSGGVLDCGFIFRQAAPEDVHWVVNNLDQTGVATNTAGAYHSMLGVNTTLTAQTTYFDGSPVITSALSAAVSTTTSQPCFHSFDPGSTGNGDHLDGWVYYGAIWNRPLPSRDARLLHDDPYCFLVYPEDEMLATLVGVTAVTTSEDRYHQPWSSVGRRYAIIAAG